MIDGIKANKVDNDEASMTTAPIIHKYDNVCENTKSAYINEDNIIRTYIAYNVADPLVRNFTNICDVEIHAKCPFCKLVNVITLKDGVPSRVPCDGCHNLLDFSHLTYGDILRKNGWLIGFSRNSWRKCLIIGIKTSWHLYWVIEARVVMEDIDIDLEKSFTESEE